MTLLQWRTAQRSDRHALQSFTCTAEGKKVKRGADWILDGVPEHERAVQSRIRTRMKPPCAPPTSAFLGIEGDAIGAVFAYTHLDGPVLTRVDLIAVATGFRGRGGAWAREALSTCLDEITYDALDADLREMTVTAEIHEQNRPSQALFREFQFAATSQLNAGYQAWAATFVL